MDSKLLEADDYIMSNDSDKLKKYEMKFDLIISTIPFNHDINIPYIDLLKPNTGTLWIIGSFFTMATDFDKINRKGRIIRGSSTASIADTQEVINLCVKKGIYPDIQRISIQKINDTHEYLVTSRARYRYVIDMSSLK